jgi:gamma-glutamyltranspeptidase
VQTALTQMGYTVQPIDSVARVEAIVVRNGKLEGGTESRMHGKVSGY